MSSPIRPVPIEAASQRTENGAKTNNAPGGFEDLLDSRIEPSDSESPEEKPREKTRPEDPWTILGITLPMIVPVDQGTSNKSSELAPANPIGVEEEAPSLALPLDKGTSVSSAALLKQLTAAPDPQQNLSAIPLPVKGAEIAENAASPAEKNGGMPVAKQTAMLLTREKSAENGSHERPLAFLSPEMTPLEHVTEFLPRATKWSETPRPQPPEIPAVEPIFSLDNRIEAPASAESSSPVEHPKAPVVELIREQVQVLRVSQQRELQVVLRPDPNTELYLHLRNEGGQVHLQARCERGDFAWLDSHWGAIQQSLSAQGVRVEPLESAFRMQNEFSGFGHDSQGERRDSHRLDSLLEIESSRSSKPAAQAARPRGTARGWQTWA